MRYCIDLGSFLEDLKFEKSLKTIVFLMVFANFHNVNVFGK